MMCKKKVPSKGRKTSNPLCPATGTSILPPWMWGQCANLTLHLGATPADELLLLEADTAEAAASSDGSSNGHPSAAACRCMEWRGATVQLCRDGVTMPSAPILQALAGSLAGTGPSQALLVLDFKQRVA